MAQFCHVYSGTCCGEYDRDSSVALQFGFVVHCLTCVTLSMDRMLCCIYSLVTINCVVLHVWCMCCI